MSEIREIQENLMDWFKDNNVDDKAFINFVDSFVYEDPAANEETSKLLERFLEENGLEVAYINVVADRKQEYFKRSSMSERDIIENIRVALLSLAYNRFRRASFKSSLADKLTRAEKNDLVMVIEHEEIRNNELIEDEATTRKLFDEDEANELIAQRLRLVDLFTKVLKIIK